MKILKITAIFSILISAICFSILFYFGNNRNWTPVSLPLPRDGQNVSDQFHIANSGEFMFGVDVAQNGDNKFNSFFGSPDIDCNMQFEIACPDGSTIKETVKLLSPASENVDFMTYRGTFVTLPKAGNYTFTLYNSGDSKILSAKAVKVNLSRFQHSTEWMLQNMLLRLAGWSFLILGVLTAIVSIAHPWWKRRFKKPS